MGPCYARALIHKDLFRDEDYYFQVDSHFRFVQDWDVVVLKELKACKSPRPVLTSYASSYTLPKHYEPGGPDEAILCPNKAPTVICADRYGDANRDDRFLRIKSRTCRTDFGNVPPPALFWTARFAFSAGAVVRDAPYDPGLEYIFFGEEIAMTVRLWTHGWDLFNPTQTIGYPLGSRSHRPWFREVQTSPDQVQAENAGKLRLCGLLHMDGPAGEKCSPPPAPYGLGSARTLEAYEKFAGVCFRTQSIEQRALNGGLGSDCFAPAWAEEARDSMMQASQMKDVESWAGKGNVDALQRQFPDAVAQQQQSNAETEKARELACMRIGSLQAQLQQQLRESDDNAAAGTECELSRAFASVGRLELSQGRDRQSQDAYGLSLRHAEEAESRAGSVREADAGWRASLGHARAAALLGLRRHADAKRELKRALEHSSEAMLQGDEAQEQVAHDILEAVHNAHEQTDDRSGLIDFIRGVQGVLKAIRRLTGEEPRAPVPIMSSAEPPSSVAVPLRAQVFERAVLICIATGRDKDMALGKSIFTDFRVARESANLQRLLGMLQSSGSFLD